MKRARTGSAATAAATRVLLTLLVALSATASDPAKAGAHPAQEAAQRGSVLRGLSARGGKQCREAYVVTDAGPAGGCTHGPDPAPSGVDVRRVRSAAELRRATGASTASDVASADPASAGSLACVGDGVSGDRVELVYAHASDVLDRYSQIAPLIQSWADEMGQAFADSAAENGGVRNLQFVTSGCQPVVDDVTLSPGGDDDLGATSRELASQGYGRGDRKYVVFVDATVYCGIAYVDGNVGRIDQGCWGSHAALHELTHNFGAVSLSAPNTSGGWHCTDESDVMCYSDSPNYPAMRQICPDWHERLLDCGGDDYFNPRPPAESFLSANPGLNVADTSFSVAEDGAVPVFLPPTPSDYRGPRYRLRADNADDDECAYGRPASGLRVRIFCIGYRGQREADITGALLALAGGRSSVNLELVATNRGGGKAYGVRLLKDGAPVLDDHGGVAGVEGATEPDLSPDPTTGWMRFYDRTVTIDFSAPPPSPAPPPASAPPSSLSGWSVSAGAESSVQISGSACEGTRAQLASAERVLRRLNARVSTEERRLRGWRRRLARQGSSRAAMRRYRAARRRLDALTRQAHRQASLVSSLHATSPCA